MKDYKHNLIVIRNSKNLGFAGGNNVGLNFGLKTKADFFLMLNNDTLVDKNFLKELLDVCISDEKIGVVVPKIYFAKGFEFHKNRYKKEDLGKVLWYAGGSIDWKNLIAFHLGVDQVDSGSFGSISETEFATGCCMLIKKEVLKKVGLLDEKYFLYYEDSDFSQRVSKAGFKIMFVPKALVWHKNAGSSGGAGSALQDYYLTRNRLLFGFTYAGTRTKIALLRQALSIFFTGRLWQKKAIMDFFIRNFGKGSFK